MIILFGLFLMACLWSMSAVDLFASLLCLMALFKAWKSRKSEMPFRLFYPVGFDLIFLAWFAVVVTGFVVNAGPNSGWKLYLLEFKWVAAWYLMVASLISLNPKISQVRPVLVFLILASVYAIALSFVGYDPIGRNVLTYADLHANAGLARTGGLMSNPMFFAHCYGFFFTLVSAVAFYLFRKKEYLRWMFLAASVLCGVGIFLSFTRGVWISLALAVLAVAWLASRKLFWGLIVVALVGLPALYFSWPTFQSRVLYAFQANSGDNLRRNLWAANWEIFKEFPLLGAGYGENKKHLAKWYDHIGFADTANDRMYSHAHNQYIHLLAGTGILGLLCYLLVQFFFLRLTLRVFRKIPESEAWHKGLILGAFGGQVHFFFGGLFESNFESAKIKYCLMLTWAIVVWLAYKYQVLSRPVRKSNS